MKHHWTFGRALSGATTIALLLVGTPVFAKPGDGATARAPGGSAAGTPPVRGRDLPDTPPGPGAVLPTPPKPVGKAAMPAVRRVKELTARRTETTKHFRLADGRVQAEVARRPVHFRDRAGKWQDIDTTVRASARPGYAFAAEKNSFTTRFGANSNKLITYGVGDRSVTLGLPGVARGLRPAASGSAVAFPAAFPAADLKSEVTAGSLRNTIVLRKAPVGPITFTVDLDGVRAVPQSDGSVAFYRSDGEGAPLFSMPKPAMHDDRDDRTSPNGKVSSSAVTQSITADGDRLLLTITPDAKWLAGADRVFPVSLTPTIKIQPTLGQAQDVMINSYEPTVNYDDLWRLSAGSTPIAVFRSLVKFPLDSIPAGTRLDAAQLKLYYDQTHTNDDFDVPIEARRMTAAWAENTATWKSSAAAMGEVGHNTEQVDNSAVDQVSTAGEWAGASAPQAVDGGYQKAAGAATGQAFTWTPRITETGTYDVQVHYVPGADRATNAPYTVHHAGGQATVTVDQTTGGNGTWKSLGSWKFNAGTTHKAVLGAVANKTVVADAIRFVKRGVDVKKSPVTNAWNTFSVRSTVQDWVDGKHPNHGFMIKSVDETLGSKGGPRYESGDFSYGGEDDHGPKLLLTWGRAGVALNQPTTIRATGADLSWSKYADPSSSPDDDVVEYQVHASKKQNFLPSAATLVAPVGAWRTSYNDTHATPTPAKSTAPYGDQFFYMVAVRTRDGSVIPSPTEMVRLPKAGQVVRFVQAGATDTTLTSKKPDTNHDVLDAGGELQVGNNGSIYGTSRVVLKFPPVTGLPAGAKVVDAEVGLWSWYTEGGGGKFQLRGLTKDFDEKTATWNNAKTGTRWAAAGGDAESTVQSTLAGIEGDPGWQSFDAAPLVQRWADDPASNKGVLIRMENESTPEHRALFLSAEADEPTLRPRLRIVYTAPYKGSTYHAPSTPGRMIPADEYTVPVTVTNTTQSIWSPSDWALSYRWEREDGTEVPGTTRKETALPSAQAPGGVVTIDAAVVAPPRGADGNRREAYVLKWDLRNKTTNQWLSQSAKIEPLDQGVAVEDPTSDQLGLEKFYQYTGGSAGSGSTVMVNQFSGNAVFGYNPLNNPSRGVSTFVRITHNTQDTSDSGLGYGWSLSASSAVRLGSPLQFRGGDEQWPAEVMMTDGDGTTHQFKLNKNNSANTDDWRYEQAAGVHLFLQRVGGGYEPRSWTMTRPDRTQFVFDNRGYQTAVRDRNGNELTLTYERTTLNGRNVSVLCYITDTTGRRTLTAEYYEAGTDYDYYQGSEKKSGTALDNKRIVGKLKSLTDVSGRRITAVYSDKGLLRELTDGAGTPQQKVFTFGYDERGGARNAKLVSIEDPRRNATKLAYVEDAADTFRNGRVRQLTDRGNKNTEIEYDDPDGAASGQILTTVTDARTHATRNLIDGYGRVEQITNAKDETTKLRWDADNNVERLEEDNGAVSTWRFDRFTGYPVELRDPEANKNNTPPTKLGYRYGLHGHTAELIEKVSPEGRRWSFGYDALGNLTSVTDPKGTATATEGDYTTSYTYDGFGQMLTSTDANDHVTRFGNFHPTGYPRDITDALKHTESFSYDALGNVLSIVDAAKSTSEYTYDVFSRPLTSKVPKSAGAFITTPAPVYDANDNVTTETAPNGAVTTAVYDKLDRSTSVTEPKDTATSQPRTSTYVYDAVGNVLRHTEPKGTLTTAVDDFTTTYVYDELDRVTQATDAIKGKATLTYDNVGNVSQEADQRKNATTDPHDLSAKYEYDLNRRLIKATDAEGFTTEQVYDKDGNRTAVLDQDKNRTEFAYDQRSMLIEQRVPHKKSGTSITYRTTRMEYDEVGNQTRVITPRGVDTTDDPDDFASVTVYDALNRVKELQQPFDKDDPKYTSPSKTIYTYSPVGDLERISAPPSDGGKERVDTVNTYYLNGWVKSSTDEFGIKTEYDYDELGAQTSRTLTGDKGAKREMSWTYFPDGKKRTQTDNGEGTGKPRKSFTYAYDVNANLTEMRDESTDAKIDAYIVSYDEVNRPASVEEKQNGAVKNTSTFEYEANDNLKRLTHERQVSEYEYNPRDLPSVIKHLKSTTDTKPKYTRYEYTSRGEVKKETKGNGNVVEKQFYLDGAEQHTVEKKSNGTVVNEHTIEYDANGHRAKDVGKKQNADNKSANLDTTTTYAYDPLDRIRTQTKTGHGAGTETYEHDANNNVISQTIGGKTTTFKYDRNRLTGATVDKVTSSYQYDAFGRLSRVEALGIELEKYTYDGFDRTAEHSKYQGGKTTYKYDPLDRQVSRTHGTKTTELQYLGLTEQLLVELEGGKVTKTYQHRPDGKLLSQVKAKADNTEEASYTAENAHSDIEQITDEKGDSRATYGYTAYGKNDDAQFTGADKPDAAKPDDPNREPYNAYRFNGKRYDQSTGDYDMGFRDYDPGLNRFLSRDNYNGALSDLALAADPWTGNRYAFAGGNPITNVELDGHNWLSDAVSEAKEWGKETVSGLANTWEALDDASATSVGTPKHKKEAAEKQLKESFNPKNMWEGFKEGYKQDKGNPVRQVTRGVLDAASLALGGAGAAGKAGSLAKAGGRGAAGAGAKAGAGAGAKGGASAGGAKAGGSAGAGVARNCLTNSFVPGTLVVMADLSHKAIEKIELGDRVLATDPEEDVTEGKPVTRLITGYGPKHLVKLTVDVDGAAGRATGEVTATAGHPFWNEKQKRWIDAGDLRPGDRVSTRHGKQLRILSTRTWTRTGKVHNLTVGGIHTYYVLAGGRDVLVHNCGTGLKNASPGLKSVYDGGSVRGRSIIGIRDSLVNNNFTQRLANNKKGYTFDGPNGETVRIMRRQGGWHLRAQNRYGNNLDEFGDVKPPAETHGIEVYSR